MIKILTPIMARCRRFIINKLGGVPREEAVVNNYRVEHVTYPTIKLAREYECQYDEETINYAERGLAREFGISLLENNLIQIKRHRGHEGNVVLRAVLEVVDKRDKGI